MELKRLNMAVMAGKMVLAEVVSQVFKAGMPRDHKVAGIHLITRLKVPHLHCP